MLSTVLGSIACEAADRRKPAIARTTNVFECILTVFPSRFSTILLALAFGVLKPSRWWGPDEQR